MNNNTLAHFEDLKSRIYTIRNKKVMLDRDLAGLYKVTTGNLNLAVKRNQDRFPSDFMFQLSHNEWDSLSLQFAILKNGRGEHRKYVPYAFTEQGIAMLSAVLKSKIAVEINIRIIRTFVELRHIITTQPEYIHLKETVNRIESRMDTIEANHLVDHMLISSKVTQLSKDVLDIKTNIHHMSKLFDEFQQAHVVIKKPEEGIHKG